MKHGVMYYLSSDNRGGMKNIGDYVQSLAADQFMRATELVERESLDKYVGEKLKVILNGWFMHRPENFPPSPDIVPLFISFHIRPSMADRLLTPQTIAYMKEHGPIGCRDRRTMAILQEKGIDAYFSSCLTLTLGLSYRHDFDPSLKGVVFVDPFHPFSKDDFRRCRGEIFRRPLMALRIFARLKPQVLRGRRWSVRWKAFWQLGAFLRVYRTLFTDETLLSAEYLSHGVNESLFRSEKEKFDYARTLLEKYSRSRYCVTSRIHCALPCVAMGTPVVFVNPTGRDMGAGRFDGMLEFFNVAEIRDDKLVPTPEWRLPAGGWLTPDAEIPVKENHLPFSRDLESRCRAFAVED